MVRAAAATGSTSTMGTRARHRLTFRRTRAETAAMRQVIKATILSLQTPATQDSSSAARTGTRSSSTRALPRGTPATSTETASRPHLRALGCPESTQLSSGSRGQARTQVISSTPPSHSLYRISLLPSKPRLRNSNSSSTTARCRRSRRPLTRSSRTSISTRSSSRCSTSARRRSRLA